MRKTITRRNFLRMVVATYAAATAQVLFPYAVRADHPELRGLEQDPADDHQNEVSSASNVVSLHYRPSIIYIKG